MAVEAAATGGDDQQPSSGALAVEDRPGTSTLARSGWRALVAAGLLAWLFWAGVA